MIKYGNLAIACLGLAIIILIIDKPKLIKPEKVKYKITNKRIYTNEGKCINFYLRIDSGSYDISGKDTMLEIIYGHYVEIPKEIDSLIKNQKL